MSVSATYCVMRYPCSLRSESITASEAGKLRVGPVGRPSRRAVAVSRRPCAAESAAVRGVVSGRARWKGGVCARSEEHTSELQSQFHLVCRLLPEKKNRRLRSGRGHHRRSAGRRAYEWRNAYADFVRDVCWAGAPKSGRSHRVGAYAPIHPPGGEG